MSAAARKPLPRNSPEWKRLRQQVLDRDGNRCVQCGATERLEADHVHELQDGGTDDVWNLTTMCRPCHSKKTAAVRKQRAAAKKSNGNSKVSLDPPRLPARLPMFRSDEGRPTSPAPTSDTAAPFTAAAREAGESDPMPWRFPAPHPDAVNSLGDRAVAWIEARLADDDGTPATELRWWQWLVLQRLLEVDADGRWCWPVAFVSVARQLGKTEILMELAAWRCANPDLFGGRPQDVGHSSNNVTLSRRVQSSRWAWATDRGYRISRLTGDTQIEWPDGSIWRTLSSEAFYGRSLDLLLIDEVWSWSDQDFWAAVWPTSAARPQAQAVLFSTAHNDVKSLVPTILANDEVATMIWQAPPDADPADPAVWRAASAYWDKQRESVMRLSADQSSFATQFLNQWPAAATATRWMPEDRWAACRQRGLEVPAQPQIAAVDDRPGGLGAAVAYAWHDGDRTCVVAEEVDTLQEAWKRASRASHVLAGISLIKEPSARLLRATGVGSRDLPTSLQALRIAVVEDSVRWDGDELQRSMGALDVVEGRDGLRVLSTARQIAVVKVAAWAAREVRQRGEDPVLV